MAMNDESEKKREFTPTPRLLEGIRQTGALSDALKGISVPPLTAFNKIVTMPPAFANTPPVIGANKPFPQASLADQPGQGRIFGEPKPHYAEIPALPTPPAEKVRRGVGSAQDLGRYVREKRIAMKLTQQELADTAGTGRRFISELEAGKSTLEFGKVLQVCRSVGVDLFAIGR